MKLLGRRKPKEATQPTAVPLRVVLASGARIDLHNRNTGPYLVATKQPWQQTAWGYRDLIGELRYSMKMLARQTAKARFYVAFERDYPDDPIPLTEVLDNPGDYPELMRLPGFQQLAADAVSNLNRLPLDGQPEGFIARLTENLTATGEAWIHGQALEGGGESWSVRSTSEITATQDGRVQLKTLPSAVQGGFRDIDPETEELLRCWVAHPEWADLADSPLRSMLDTCEDIILAGRELRAAARSRIAANGVLFVPDSMSITKARTEDDEQDESLEGDTFEQSFIEAMLAPISNEGDAGAVVPILVRGGSEDGKEIRHIKLDRLDAEKLIDRLNAALGRLLRGLDVQPEKVDGIGAVTSHWSAWAVEAASVRDQIEPAAGTDGSCLTQAYLRPALLELDHPHDLVSRVLILADVSDLVENPDRGQDARDAHAAMVISDEALNRELGFNPEDMPDEDEVARRLAAKAGVAPDVAALILGFQQALAQIQQDKLQAHADRMQPAALPQAAPADGPRPAAPGQSVPEQPAPVMKPPPAGPIVAAAPPDDGGWQVDVDTARALADLDAALAERIITAVDAAIARVVEKAGSRVRSQAQKNPALRASLVGMDVLLIPPHLGREQVETFANIPDLISDSYTRLRSQFTGWIKEAALAAADLVIKMLRLDTASPRAQNIRTVAAARVEANTTPAWDHLYDAMNRAAEQALFTPQQAGLIEIDVTTEVTGLDELDALDLPEKAKGEAVDTLIAPGDVFDVLTIAGGGRPVHAGATTETAERPQIPEQRGSSGIGTGPIIEDLLTGEGAVLLGWEWRYNQQIPRNTFEPHKRLDGKRFATWTSPVLDVTPDAAWLDRPFFRPGDHKGCVCDSAAIWATPEPSDVVDQRLRPEALDAMTRQMAEEDDRAGRVGTTAQNTRDLFMRLSSLRADYIEGEGRGAA